MFSKEEKKHLAELLSHASDPVKACSLDELGGFLFGLAITPGRVDSSEWMDGLFGDRPPIFITDSEERRLKEHLFKALDRRVRAHHQDTLAFPFKMEKLEEDDLERILGWSFGFFTALSLRPYIWGLSSEEIPPQQAGRTTLSAPSENLSMSLAVIMAAAFPEDMDELFEQNTGVAGEKELPEERIGTIITLLPFAVATLQAYSREIPCQAQTYV